MFNAYIDTVEENGSRLSYEAKGSDIMVGNRDVKGFEVKGTKRPLI